jgi:RHS repeat-associated protein
MTDGSGVTQYSYVLPGSLGALRLLQEQWTGLTGATTSYGYDPLGRTASRTVGIAPNGSGPETFQYDAIGRLTGHTSDLGTFTLSYLGQTQQITTRALNGTSLATTWSYLPNSGDRRLAGIANSGLSAGQFSNYQFTTNAANFITAITETADANTQTAYPPPGQSGAAYNAANQVTRLAGSGLTFAYDRAGNLLSDGVRTYTWDAENRLISVSLPNQPSLSVAFTYDGLGRRRSATLADTAATTFVWCGERLCQAQQLGQVRGYYAEGAFLAGVPLYYGVDQIGSVRRGFLRTGASASDFDPYGAALQPGLPAADFGFAGLFLEKNSGLYLATYRAYDPATGRWLSRDPIGEEGGINLYEYVGGQPISAVDTAGTQLFPLFARPPIIPRIPEALRPLKERIPRQSGKEGAKDVPSWCRGEAPRVGESGSDFARRLLDDKYGPGNYERGPTSEFNRIQKWGDRAFRDPTSIPLFGMGDDDDDGGA